MSDRLQIFQEYHGAHGPLGIRDGESRHDEFSGLPSGAERWCAPAVAAVSSSEHRAEGMGRLRPRPPATLNLPGRFAQYDLGRLLTKKNAPVWVRKIHPSSS